MGRVAGGVLRVHRAFREGRGLAGGEVQTSLAEIVSGRSVAASKRGPGALLRRAGERSERQRLREGVYRPSTALTRARPGEAAGDMSPPPPRPAISARMRGTSITRPVRRRGSSP